MPQVLVVNPSARKGRKVVRKGRKKGVVKMAKKRRSAAQKAATRKLVALMKSRRGGHRTAKTVHRRKRRAAPRRRVAHKTVVHHVTARRRATHRRKYRRSSVAAASAAGRTLRYRRTNPFGRGILGDTFSMLVPAAMGGIGALGTDVLMGVLPLPDTIKTGPFRPVVRIAAAVGLGVVAGMVTSKATAKQFTAGALTVILYDTLKGFLSQTMGGKIPGLSLYEIPGIGMYEVVPPAQIGDMGYKGSGMVTGSDQISAYMSGVDEEPGVYR
jgi:hypothetical protein